MSLGRAESIDCRPSVKRGTNFARGKSDRYVRSRTAFRIRKVVWLAANHVEDLLLRASTKLTEAKPLVLFALLHYY